MILRKQQQGEVVRHRGQQTALVRIDRVEREPMYGKVVRIRKQLMVHDPKNESHVGDKVVIEETRPLSNSKRWKLVQVVERAPDAAETGTATALPKPPKAKKGKS